jgi:hypothetical protein
MNRRRKTALFLALVILGAVDQLIGQELQIGIIDFYGLGRVSEREARQALTFKEGDTISLVGDDRPAFLAASERQLSTLSGVTRAHTNLVCCDEGRGIVYVGLEEQGRPTTHFRAAPRGSVRLAMDIVQAGNEFSEAFMAAVRRGDTMEDESQGHALAHDPATRAIQDRFIGYAARDLRELRRVLRDSSDAEQRALAAEVLGYVANKQDVVGDLVYGMSDASADVRNNAMRALAVFASVAPSSGRPTVRVPYEPFIEFLHSPVWTDRNKASFALVELSERRDPKLLGKLRREAMASLIEMARWKSKGHAMPALIILGRIGGQSDDVIEVAWARGEREGIINAALKRQ